MKLLWPRTLQLLPAHLQSRDQHIEDLLALRTGRCLPDGYGIVHLTLDERPGAQGAIVITRLEALLPSGLVVQIEPGAPLRRNVPEASAAGAVRDVYVGVPRTLARGPNVHLDGAADHSTRYAVTVARQGSEVAWMRAKPEILFEEELHEGLESLRIGRVRTAGKSARFERDALPTVLRVRASSTLQDGLRGLVQACEARRRELVRYRADHPFHLGSVAEADLPALQLSVILQRYLPLLADSAGRHSAHPRELYQTLVAVYGALAVFGLMEIAPAYDHDDPSRVFPWLFGRIEKLVNEAARDTTTVLPFQRVNETTFRLSFGRGDLAGKRPLLVLSAADEFFLRDRVPGLLKMASPSAIIPLLDSAVRGAAVAVEFEVPAAVPRRTGVVAYRIDLRDPHWLDIEDRLQVQLQLVGAPPGLQAWLYGVERTV